MANETWKFVQQAKSKQAMKQVLGIIKNETACMKVTPPLAVAFLAHGDDMRWNPKQPEPRQRRQLPPRPGGTAERIYAGEQSRPRGRSHAASGGDGLGRKGAAPCGAAAGLFV